MDDKLLVTGQVGQHDGQRRLVDGWRCQSLDFGEKEEAPSQNSWGNLVEKMDNSGRVGHLKCVDVQALMHYHRVAVRQCECQDLPKITLGNIGIGVVVVLIHVIDIPGDRGELNNPWTGRGSCTSKIQWTGSIRIHDLGRRLHDRNPDDEHKEGDSVGGDGRLVKGDHDPGQGTKRGDNDHDDNPCVESRLSFNF